MEAKQKIALTFALYQGEVLVRRETTTTDIVKVGRDPKSHLRVDDALACRMHAVIEAVGADCITLIDLGNEPGTMVNGERVSKRRIVPGDQLSVGGTTIILEKAEAVAVATQASVDAPRAPSANPFGAANVFGAPAEPFAWNNPFASAQPAPSVDEVAADAPEGSYTFAMLKSGPDMLPEECEGPSSAIEVMILWDTTVLHVSHLTPPRSFYVGEEQSKNVTCDYFLPSERLGATRAPVVLVDRSGAANLVILPRAKGTIEIAGQPKITVADALARGLAQPCAELSGAAQMPFPQGSKATIEVDGLTFKVAAVNAGRAVAAAPIITESLPYHGISAFVHASLLAAMAFLMPTLGATGDDAITSDQSVRIRQYLDVAGETNKDAKPAEDLADAADRNEREGGQGQRSAGEEGAMGSPVSKATGKRYAIEGPRENEDPRIARERALRDARDFGMVGILNSGGGGDPDAPIAPWGGADSLGNDPMSARGGMWGNEIGDSFAAGGLGLTGVGEMGGGRGEGIGLGMIGTIGHGAGGGPGQGFGRNSGRLAPGHRVASPVVRIGTTTASGHLPAEVIQRIVRQNFGRFRLCYENGLRSSPSLQGRVAVRFVIGRDGAVSSVGNGGSDLPDPGVVSCVVRAFYGLSFPSPESGIVTVVYPIMFSPGS
jgi:hypothetical protein